MSKKNHSLFGKPNMKIESLFLSQKTRARYFRIVNPVGNLLARIGIHPHVLSVTGLILSAAAGMVYSTGTFFWAAWILVIAGVCDTLDGQLARQTQKTSPFGAFFDSFLDRYSDVFILAGLAYYYACGRGFLLMEENDAACQSSPLTVFVILMAITGSFMVSYARARAEGLGLDCRVGLMQRSERITLLVIGSLLGSLPLVGPILMKTTLLILAVSSNVTALHRMLHVKNYLKKVSK